jgi:hypothetical protein
MQGEKSWFAVRCVYIHPPSTYEERITLWRAESLEHAISLAETDATEHAEIVGARYLDFAQAYGPLEEDLSAGTEVFSLMRDSSLNPERYVSRFFDSGAEQQKKVQGFNG